MFDQFVKAAFVSKKNNPFSKAPTEVVQKVASGALKTSFCRHGDDEWLEKFKGTPLMDQALQLEQQSIQTEMAELQNRQQTSETSRRFWEMRDQMDLQKRMLELQLVMAKNQPPIPPSPSPVDEAPPAPEEGSEAGPPVPGAATEKMSAAIGISAQNLEFADAMGRKLAHADMEKMALAVPGGLAGLGQAAKQFVKTNPVGALSAAGGALGAGYGAMSAQGEGGRPATLGQRLKGAVGYGAAGAGAGALAGGGLKFHGAVRNQMQAAGQTARQAAGHVGGDWLGQAAQGAEGLVGKHMPGRLQGYQEAVNPYVQRMQEGIKNLAQGAPQQSLPGIA